MIIDQLGMLRADGSSPRVAATEAGATSLVRDSATGKVVIGVFKTGYAGLPIVALTDDATGTGSTAKAVVTIEASDVLAFSTPEVVATYPAITGNVSKATLMVRRVHTQKKYLRSVITCSGIDATNTISVDFMIIIGHALMNT